MRAESRIEPCRSGPNPTLLQKQLVPQVQKNKRRCCWRHLRFSLSKSGLSGNDPDRPQSIKGKWRRTIKGKGTGIAVVFLGIGKDPPNGCLVFGIKPFVFRADYAVIVFIINAFHHWFPPFIVMGRLQAVGSTRPEGFCFDVSRRRGANRPRRSSTRRGHTGGQRKRWQ